MVEEASKFPEGLPLQRWLSVYGNSTLQDSVLTSAGIAQCKLAAEHLQNYDIQILMLSPLRRAIETAYHTFQSHPNFANMQIILHPLLREKVTVSCDVPLSNASFRKSLTD